MKRLRCCCGLSVVVHAGLGFAGLRRIIIENLDVELFGLNCNAQHWSEADKVF